MLKKCDFKVFMSWVFSKQELADTGRVSAVEK